MRDPGVEPGSVPWQGTILPLNQPRCMDDGVANITVHNTSSYNLNPGKTQRNGGRT